MYAQEGNAEPGRVTVTELVVSPAAAPEPRMKYRFFPDVLDLKSGDAGGLYTHAALLAMEELEEDDIARLKRGLTVRLARAADYKEFPGRLDQALGLVRESAARQGWAITPGGLLQGEQLMPQEELDAYRALTQCGVLRSRIAVAENRYNDAVKAIGSLYVLACRLNEAPQFLPALAGLDCRKELDDQVLELIQQPRAPNLYHALSELPPAWRAMATPVEYEMKTLLMAWPALRNPREKLATPEQWERSTAHVTELLPPHADDPRAKEKEIAADFFQADMLEKLGPEARAYLADEMDMAAGEVRRMPRTVAIGLYLRDLVLTRADQATTAWSLPYAQGMERLSQVSYGELFDSAPRLLAVLMPPLRDAAHRAIAEDRRVAALMCVEALRMHAAETGQLPAKLEEITVVPVPDDPMSGEPFAYSLQDGVATLRQSVPPEQPGEHEGIHYRIRLRE
jgi:hypothetical protein